MSTAALYVHLPWCVRKCPYCDFNSYRRRDGDDEWAYVAALLADLDAELERGAVALSSVFIGGGTPSLFSGSSILALMRGIAARAGLPDGIEVTLEANPGAADAARFRAYREAGVNRLSLGVQSFDDARLVALGRVHDGAAARHAIEAARAAGFERVNLDLMFGLPGEGPGDSLRDLDEALRHDPAHVSWYQLTIEPGTVFARRRPALPEHDRICDDYEAGLERLAAAGFEHYEVSAHARAGARSRHNLNYWRFGDYLGIGAGAHGKRSVRGGIVRTEKARNPQSYVKAALAGGALAVTRTIRGTTLVSEFMLNALRLKEGFPLEMLERRTGMSRASIAGPLRIARERGWLEQRGDGVVRPTALGFRFLDDLQLLFVDDGGGEAAYG